MAIASGAMAASASCRSPLVWFFSLAAALFFASWYLLLDSAAAPAALDARRQGPRSASPARKCDPATALLRVFMYDLPLEFHFGLLDWKPGGAAAGGGLWPDVRHGVPEYPGGLNLQHSIEYWLTLDLLASEQGAPTPCNAVRVRDPARADVVFVPFFATLSAELELGWGATKGAFRRKEGNADYRRQREVVDRVTAHPAWRRSGGRDHVFVLTGHVKY